MVARNSKIFVVIGLLFIVFNTTQAQTLIKESSRTKKLEKSWKIELGILTGAGVSNILRPNMEPIIDIPEGMNTYRVKYAPRPEAQLGLFTEIGKSNSIYSFQVQLSYTMRAMPKPVFYNYSNDIKEVYKSTYLNGGTAGFLFCIKPVDRFKIGVGLDFTSFLILDDVENSDIGEYTNIYRSSAGLKVVFTYKVSPRIDVNVYSRLGRISGNSSMAPDDISAGMTVGYRLVGKEIKYKAKLEETKQVYKLDYK
jgi:hypothetical protein